MPPPATTMPDSTSPRKGGGSGQSRRPKVFLVGLYGVNNLGDEAIRDSIERAGAKLGIEISNYAVRTDQVDPRAVRLRSREWHAYLRAIWNADRIVIGGGGLLKDESRTWWRGYGLLLDLLVTAAFARLLGRSVALIGMGVGPIYSRLGHWLIRAVAVLAGCRVVRDQDSAVTLAGLGVNDVQVFADPAFSMRDAMIVEGVSARQQEWPPRRMLISARPWYQMAVDGPRQWSRLVAAIALLADEAIEDGLRIEFACLYWPQDLAAAKEIMGAMRHSSHVEIPSMPTDWWGLASAIRRSDVVVSMRYHAVVCASMTETPVFALAYEPKVTALAGDLGILVADVNDVREVETLPAKVSAFRQADAPVPPYATIRSATDRLSASAWRGLSRALAS